MTGPEAEDGVAPFVWPPAGRQDDPITQDSPEAEGADEAPTVAEPGWAARVEADLLGVRAVSFGRWAAATGWRPEPWASFCWRCAGSVGPHETDGTGCAACRGKRLAWDRAARLGLYEGGLRAGVMGLKFGRWRRSGRELGRAMGARLAEMLAAGGVEPREAVLVPVPTSWRRRMERGVDHTAVLAVAAGRESGVAVVRGLGRRHTRPQVGLTASARAENIRGAFRGREGAKDRVREARVIVVVDDVRTTGATLTAGSRAVRRLAGKGPQIWILTGAVVGDGRGSGGLAGGDHEKIAKTFVLAV
jgi:predicted amidophosphoribosyltransferase